MAAKDIILNLISRIGIGGGTAHVFEYRGSAIRALSMEERMTVCNMSIEAGARAGLVAPDDFTFNVKQKDGRTALRYPKQLKHKLKFADSYNPYINFTPLSNGDSTPR